MVIDVLSKEYFGKPERYADLFNGILFGGTQVILPSELQVVEAELNDASKKKAYRSVVDLLMLWVKDGRKRAYLYLEEQSKKDSRMVARKLKAEGIGYLQQFARKGQFFYLSDTILANGNAISENNQVLPMIGLVVYLGKEPWDAPTSLTQMLIPCKEIEEYVQDTKINLVDYHDMLATNVFKSDLYILFETLKRQGDKEAMLELYKGMAVIRGDLMRLVAKLTNMKHVKKYLFKDETGEEKGLMCKAFEDMRAEGRSQGKAEGIEAMLLAVNRIRAGATKENLKAEGFDHATIKAAFSIA